MNDQLTEEEFQDMKTHLYQEISENKAEIFNYFLENNDIYQCIDRDDEELCYEKYANFLNTTMMATFGSFFGVCAIDQVLFRMVKPPVRV